MSLLVLCLFLLYRLLNMFRATLCPSSGADDLEVFIGCVAERGCVGSQIRLVACLSIGKHLTQKWHLVGLFIHTELRCTVNHTSKKGYNNPIKEKVIDGKWQRQEIHKLSSETLKERDNLRYLGLCGKVMNKENNLRVGIDEFVSE